MHPDRYPDLGESQNGVDPSLTANTVLPAPLPLPVVIPKSESQKKADSELASALQGLMADVAASIQATTYQLKKPSSSQLNETLTAAGFAKPAPGYEAHHIVPWDKNTPAAIAARAILKKVGIGIHSANNLIWLPGLKSTPRAPGDLLSLVHRGDGIHSNLYLSEVNALLLGVSNANQANVALSFMKAQIRAGIKFWE